MTVPEQPALFGEISPTPVLMPQLPAAIEWQAHRPNARDRCDYCLMVMVEQDAMNVAGPPVRRPTWVRTSTDGAVLMLCEAHADKLSYRGERS